MKTFFDFFIGMIPKSTLASIIAEYVTVALKKINNKETAEKIAEATANWGTVVSVTSEAVKDCEITEEEISVVAESIKTAIVKTVEASK